MHSYQDDFNCDRLIWRTPIMQELSEHVVKLPGCQLMPDFDKSLYRIYTNWLWCISFPISTNHHNSLASECQLRQLALRLIILNK